MNTYDKEAIYDEQISPLMSRIIEICKEHEMPLFFTAHFKTDENGPCFCTTSLPLRDETHDTIAEMKRVIYKLAIAIAEMVQTMPDGSTNITVKRVS